MVEHQPVILNLNEAQGRATLPISAYLFILVMEVFFTMIRNNPKIEGLHILGFTYPLTSYADDTTFSLKMRALQSKFLKLLNIFQNTLV